MINDFPGEVTLELSFEEGEFGQQSWKTEKVNLDVLSSCGVLLGPVYRAVLPVALHRAADAPQPCGPRPPGPDSPPPVQSSPAVLLFRRACSHHLECRAVFHS